MQHANNIADRMQNVCRVLIVSDETGLCALLTNALVGPRRTVEVRGSARSALELVQQQPVDLAFVGLRAPNGALRELADQIQRQCPQASVVLCSGYLDQDADRFPAVVRNARAHRPSSVFGDVLAVAGSSPLDS